MPFNPKDLTGNILALDASVTTTLTASATASYPAAGDITDGTAVGTWFDRSGNGHHFSNDASIANSYKPIWHSSGGALNNQPYLDFISTGVNVNATVLAERAATLYNTFRNSNTVLILFSARTNNSFGTLIASEVAGEREWILSQGQVAGRYSGLMAPLTNPGPGGLAYTYDSASGVENMYVNSAQTPGTTSTNQRTVQLTAQKFTIGAGETIYYALKGEVYEIYAYNRTLSNSEIALVYSYWNGIYNTTFNTSAGPLAVPEATAVNVGTITQTVGISSAIGGTAPYTYQWYRSGTLGTKGPAINGATTKTLNDSGLTISTDYYYTLTVTDAAAASVDSAQLYSPTHGSRMFKIGFLGDSITIGSRGGFTPAQAWAEKMFLQNRTLDLQLNNLAVGGQSLRGQSPIASTVNGFVNNGIAATIASWNAPGFTPDYIMWMQGINDINGYGGAGLGFADSQFPLDVAATISAIRTAYPSVKIIINDIMGTSTSAQYTKIQQYNQVWTDAIAANSSFMVRGSNTDFSYFTANQSQLEDGLHPNATGVQNLAQQWVNATANLFANVLPDTTPPSIPNDLSGQHSNIINLTWSAVNDATGYMLRINGATAINVGIVTTYLHAGITNGTTYTYEIASYDSSNNISEYGAQLIISLPALTQKPIAL